MNWNIIKLEVTTEGDLEDVVVTAHWTLDDAQEGYTAYVYGSTTFPPPSDDFTPYDELTIGQVLGWIWDNGVDKDQQEAVVAERIEAQINPPITTPPLPWVTEAPAEESTDDATEEVA